MAAGFYVGVPWKAISRAVDDVAYNHFLNILRLFDVLPNLPFATSETKHNY